MSASPTTVPELTPDSIIERLHRQLDTDRDDGLLAGCDETLLDNVIVQSVHGLWEESRIKTYVPVLALRRARDQIRAATSER
jgi:hypothetical protein